MFFDYDNDGDLDLYFVAGLLDHNSRNNFQPNALFENNNDLTFTDISVQSGADDDGIGRGGAFGDFNNDGCIDMVIGNLGTYDSIPGVSGDPRTVPGIPLLFQNNCTNTNNWIIIKTVGTISNVDGIGARVKLTTIYGEQIREVAAGGSHISQNMLPVHFGLYDATQADIEITWPSGVVQTLTNIAPNQILQVVEDSELPSEIHDMSNDAFSVNPLVVTQGDIINFQATITNLGNVDESKARVNYRDTTDGINLIGQNFAINAGDTFVGDVKQWDTGGASIGTHVLKAHVRPSAGFVDADPSNNDIFVTVTVDPPAGPPPTEIHDMRADILVANPLVVTQGDIINLQATITNLGNVDEEKARIGYRDTLTETRIGAQYRIQIDAGETMLGSVIQWDTTDAILGDHVIRANVRPTGGFVDADPSNNNIFVTVTINPP